MIEANKFYNKYMLMIINCLRLTNIKTREIINNNSFMFVNS